MHTADPVELRNATRPRVSSAATRLLTGRMFPFAACIAASILIFFVRNPDPWVNPTIYAEDGWYVRCVFKGGFWDALLAARPDYLAFGNVFLGWLSVETCRICFDSNVLLLPQIIAVVSWTFFAVAVSLPVLLMRNYLRLRYLLVLWLVTSFVPLERIDNEVLGRLCNTGYAFLYIAVVLLWYRNNAAARTASFAATDVSLWVCAATNPLCLAILPLAGWRYLRLKLQQREGFLAIISRRDFVSLCFLALACVPVAHRVITAKSVAAEAGPPPWDSVVELVFARNFLYPLVHSFYGHLNHALAVSLFITSLLLLLLFHQRSSRELYLMCGLVLVLMAAMLVTGRAWLVPYVAGYGPSFVHRYFYVQGLLVLLMAVRLGADVMENPRWPQWLRVAPLALLAVFFANIDRQSSYGSPSPEMTALGTFPSSLRRAVDNGQFTNGGRPGDPNGRFVWTRIYPADAPWSIALPRDVVERSLQLNPRMAAGARARDRQ